MENQNNNPSNSSILAGLDQIGNASTPLPKSSAVALPLVQPVEGWNDEDRMDLLTLDNANIRKVMELLDGSRNFREACDLILDKTNA